MSHPPAPTIVRHRRSLPLIWVVPLVAFLVGGWLIARSYRERGPEITIRFQNGAGIEEGKTILEHKGVAVGTVENVQLDEKHDSVLVKVRLVKNAAYLARADSEFWLVRPEIGFSGIKGLDTLFTGARLKVRPGTGGQPATEFTALRRAPLLETSGRGRSFVLRADRLGALNSGAPVFFREIKVGFIEAHRLTPDADGVLVRIRIRTPYDQLVHADTKFWNSGGVSVKVGLLGAELRSNSLESLVTGGISFATPSASNSAPVTDDTEFLIADEADKEWLKWKPKIPIQESVEDWETTPEAEPSR
ncbi:MAG TPA: MlaD family protein [Lacunisphaera sp.]